MRIVIDVKRPVYERIKLLLPDNYGDLQTFIDVAMMNQLHVEENRTELLEKEDRGGIRTDSIERRKVWKRRADSPVTSFEFPKYRELGKNWSHLSPVPAIGVDRVISQHMPFCNRIFPVKVVVRVLANMLDQGADWIDLDIFRNSVSKIAQDLGRYLLSTDRASGRSLRMGGALSAGFPVGRRGSMITAQKFFNWHVVGSLLSDGRVKGMAPALGFASLSDRGQVGITKDGVTFAALSNPILDNGIEEEGTLSEDERMFYLNHVENRLPYESKLIKNILATIQRGVVRHRAICENQAGAFGGLSSKARNSMVSTVMARMKELKLLTSEQRGAEIFYKVS